MFLLRMRTVPLVGIEQTLGVVLVNATSVRLALVLVRFEALGEFFCSVGVHVKPLRGWEEASFDALPPNRVLPPPYFSPNGIMKLAPPTRVTL
jgi:hypothetical protein